MVSRLLNLLPPHFKTMFFSGVVGVGVGLTVFWRDRLIAQNFGIGQESDIFFLTLAFPVFVASVFTSLSVSGFMPTYLQNRELLVAQKMLTVHLAAAGLIVLVALCFIPFLPPSYQRSCYWLLLLIPITAMASLFVSLLQSHRKYLFVNSLPAIPSLLAVGAIFFFSGHGIIATIYGTIAGYFLMLVVASWRAWRLEGTVVPVFRLQMSESLSVILRQYGALIIGVTAMAANAMIDQFMAAQYGVGQASSIIYGARITNLVIALVAAAISNIILTELSHIVAANDPEKLRRTTIFYERFFMLAMLFVAVLIFVFSAPLIGIVFGQNSMEAAQLSHIALLQRLYILQIPFYVGGMVYVHRLSAEKRNNIITRIAVTNFVLNIVLNIVLGHYWGVPGIAAATSLVYLHSYLQLRFYFMRRKGRV